MQTSAVIDETGQYRYRLGRCWLPSGKRACFIMLNPSTADATQDDPTIRRCIGFARSWGCGSLEVVNLFAYRATSPTDLRKARNPFGPENNEYIQRAARAADLVVAAWGAHGGYLGQNRLISRRLLDIDLLCLGVTKKGYPRHPLYVAGNTELQQYPFLELEDII